jgi:hypothetical protein
MAAIEIGGARELLEAAVTAVSVMGGAMAYLSGFYASQALAERGAPEIVSQRINEGIGIGFLAGSPLAIAALIIEAWT